MSEETLLTNYSEVTEHLRSIFTKNMKDKPKKYDLPKGRDSFLKAITLMRVVTRDAFKFKYIDDSSRHIWKVYLDYCEKQLVEVREYFKDTHNYQKQGFLAGVYDTLRMSGLLWFSELVVGFLISHTLLLPVLVEKSKEEKEGFKEEGEKLKKLLEETKKKTKHLPYIE